MWKEPKVEYPAPEDARPPTQTWRILFLDRAKNVEKLKDACKHAGYAVVGATTIEEAWAFLQGEDRADVIVCAAHLEEGGGGNQRGGHRPLGHRREVGIAATTEKRVP